MTVTHWRTLIVVLVIVFAGAILAVQLIADSAAQRLTDQQVLGCERGNVIREFLSFDNEQRIIRLEQQLANPAQVTDADKRSFTSELERRYVQRADLQPFDCESLR